MANRRRTRAASGKGRWSFLSPRRVVCSRASREGDDRPAVRRHLLQPARQGFETAEIIAREAGFTGEIVPIAGLMERHGGSLEGTTHTEREARNPELTRKLLGLPEEERWTLVGAETDEEVLARFEEAISDIRARHDAGARLVVVSHGGVMRAFLRDRFGPGCCPAPCGRRTPR